MEQAIATYTDYLDELLRVFHIGPDDLEANRQGRLGPSQQRLLGRRAYTDLLMAAGMAAGVAAILAFVSPKPLKVAQVIVAAIVAGAVLATGIFSFVRQHQAVAESGVDRFVGPVSAHFQRRVGWNLHVAGQVFKLPVRASHIQNGASYHVYVTNRAKKIVAMEPEGWP